MARDASGGPFTADTYPMPPPPGCFPAIQWIDWPCGHGLAQRLSFQDSEPEDRGKRELAPGWNSSPKMECELESDVSTSTSVANLEN